MSVELPISKFYKVKDFIDKNPVGAYKFATQANGVTHELHLYTSTGEHWQYEFAPEDTLEEINQLAAYVRQRVL